MKTCSCCGVDKPRTKEYWTVDKSRKDGLDKYCKDCKKVKNRQNREDYPDYFSLYYQENKEDLSKYSKQWRKDNLDKVRSYDRKKERKRRALKSNVKENFTPEQEYLVRSMFKNQCLSCGMTQEEHNKRWNERLHIDHIQPLSKGYALSPTNACLLCRSCNSSKHNKDPEDFFSSYQLGLLYKYRDYLLSLY